MSKRQMARQPDVTAPYFEWILVRQETERFARPLWQHLNLEPPLGEKLKIRAKVPYSEIDLDQATSCFRSTLAIHRSARVINMRSRATLVVQYLKLAVEASAVGHAAFGVVDQAAGDGGAEALSTFSGPFNLLGNWRVGILLGHGNKVVHIPFSFSEGAWKRIQGPLNRKAVVAHRRAQECAGAAGMGDSGHVAAQAGGAPAGDRVADAGLPAAAAATAAPGAAAASAAVAAAAAPAGAAGAAPEVPMSIDEIGHRLYPRVASKNEAQAGKITGMLLELPPEILRYLLISEDALLEQIKDAEQELQREQQA
jgi:hypothetical protein